MNRDFILKWAFTLILFLIGLFCYMKDYGYCDYYFRVPVNQEYLYQNLECRISPQVHKKQQPTHTQRQKWQDAYDEHHFHAVRTYQDAYNKVWWLPNLSFRQIGRDAWVAACGSAGGSNLTARLVIAFSTMLSAYGLHCLDEWDYIKEKLSWSQYHFEQCAHYAGMLNK